MSGITKESTVKSVPEECDEWLTTRNKRKASPFQRPIKKHKASSTPLREITRDNQPFLLTQNSPPPPQLKTCTKQSDIKSFFKAQNQTDHHGKVKASVQLPFKDDDGIISSDDSDEERKENLNLRSHNSPLDKSRLFSRKQIQNLDDEESKPQYVEKESERNEYFNPIYKNDKVVDSPKFNRSNCGNLIEQCVESGKIHKPVHRRDLILKDIHTETSLLSSNREEVHHVTSSSIGKYDFNKEDETDRGQEHLEQKQKFYKEDGGFTETEFSMPDICLVAPNKKSKEQQLTCDRFTCPLCCEALSESLACSCDNTSCTETSTHQSNRSHLINSEEADLELDNFSLSLNTQYLT